MKKLINDPKNVVDEMLSGLIAAHGDKLARVPGYNVIVRRELKTGKVGLVSGGGSGHEPAHAGFVGYGLLDAAVCGNVFASPSPDEILQGIVAADSGEGVLLVVKNYSGDVMNFDAARELAEFDDIKIETVIVDDDVAIAKGGDNAGRRGVAGTILVHKIAGALAERGAGLGDVAETARRVVENIRSMGMALNPGILPEAGKARFILETGEMEIGIGIHGEPGVWKSDLAPASEIATHLLTPIFADLPLKPGDEIAVIINGMGGTPLMELYIMANEILSRLSAGGLQIHRALVGNYMTSLEMAGCSVTILKLDERMKGLLEDRSEAVAFSHIAAD